MLDGAGRLWVLDAATGDLVWIDHGERATRRTRQNAATAGAGQLVLADGAPVVIDTARRRAVLFDGRTGEPGASLGLDLRADDQLRASGSPHSRRIYVATASGVLDICDLAARRCTDVLTLGASGRSDLGVPVEAGGALFVPDYATGTVWVVDLKQPRVLAHPRVLDQPARFQLLAHDGIVFFNDPDSEHAGVVRVDGGVQPVAKYELGHPTGDQPPANPPAAPPPSTPPSRSVPVPPTPATSPSPAPSKAPGAPLAERPALRISVSQSSALVGQEVTLTLVVSGDARPTGVRWSFGDGQGAVGVLTTHRWTAPQTYQITVQATFSSGQPTTASVPFVVTAVPVAMGTLRIVLNGVGTVASRPTGISCPGTCSTTFPVGTVVALTAAPAPTAQFTGWAGPCTGTGACQVTVAPGVTQLDATFAPLPTGDVTPPKISVRPHTTVFHPSNFDKVCGTPTGVGLIADVADAGGVASVWFDYRIATPSPLTGTVQMTPNGPGAYFGGLGSFPVNGNTAAGGAVTVDFHAKDRAGNEAVVTVTDIILKDCPQIR
ncbi:MAG: hypothetical protein AUI14_11180 [Actinobacteria bacterium 13_2_20CM_2_71_6]|nr:MAG: hypothetical protein AUI14_11180 [Actinobacteria bacterium 13_2_20CM_2_71_6]